MNFKMSTQTFSSQFVRSYSRGQITIPQEFREYLGISSGDWLFLTIKDGCLVMMPIKEEKIMEKRPPMVEPKISFKDYLKVLSAAKGAFGPEIEKEYKQISKEVEERLKKLQF